MKRDLNDRIEELRNDPEQLTREAPIISGPDSAAPGAAEELDHRLQIRTLADLRDDIDTKRRARQSGIAGAPIGLGPIRERFGSWGPGAHIIMGRPGDGKSQLVLQEALHAAKKGWHVLYLTLELEPVEVEARLVAEECEGSWAHMLTTESEEENYTGARERLSDALGRVYVNGGAGVRIGVEDLPVVVRQLLDKAGGTQCMFVLDYLQRVGGKGELRERVSDAANMLATLGHRHSMPVLAVASAGRKVYERLAVTEWKAAGSAEGLLDSGKESGDIEYAAQSVMVIAHQRGDNGAVLESRLALAKRREGGTGWIEGLKFSGGRWVKSEAANVRGGGMGAI